MLDRCTSDLASWLTEFGFELSDAVISDHGLGMRYDFGNLKLDASFVMGQRFNDVVLFTGIYSTPRTYGLMEFEIPRKPMTRDLCAALIADYIDRFTQEKFEPIKLSPWLELGRANKHLLPREIARIRAQREAELYQARPHCTVDREWLKLALKRLTENLSQASDLSPVVVKFDGRVLSFQCESKEVVVEATGTAWSGSFTLPAGALRALPRRLMSSQVDVSVWKENLKIDRYHYPNNIDFLQGGTQDQNL